RLQTAASGHALRIRGIAARRELVAVGEAVAVAVDPEAPSGPGRHAREGERRRRDADERPERAVGERRRPAPILDERALRENEPAFAPADLPSDDHVAVARRCARLEERDARA